MILSHAKYLQIPLPPRTSNMSCICVITSLLVIWLWNLSRWYLPYLKWIDINVSLNDFVIPREIGWQPVSQCKGLNMTRWIYSLFQVLHICRYRVVREESCCRCLWFTSFCNIWRGISFFLKHDLMYLYISCSCYWRQQGWQENEWPWPYSNFVAGRGHFDITPITPPPRTITHCTHCPARVTSLFCKLLI